MAAVLDDPRWAQLFELRTRGAPAWTQEDETELHQAIQAGEVPSRFVTSPPQLSPASSAAAVPPPTPMSSQDAILAPLIPAGARAVQQFGDLGATTVPSTPTTSVPPFVAAPGRPFPENPIEIPKYLLDEYGPMLLAYPPAVIVALKTGNLPLAARGAAIGGAQGLGQFFSETALQKPASGTPEAQGNYGPAAQRAARTALITFGATLGGAAMPAAVEGAPLLARAARGLTGALTTGVGAGAGSLAAEPIAPTSDAFGTAKITAEEMAKWDAGFRAGGAILKTMFGKSRFFAPRGEEAAQILKEEGAITPATVVLNMPVKTAESAGEASLLGGSLLRRARARDEGKLSEGITKTQAQGALPTDTAVRAALDRHGYIPGFTDAAKGAQAQARQGIYNEVDSLLSIRVAQQNVPVRITEDVSGLASQIMKQSAPAAGTPLHAALTALTRTQSMTTPQLQRLAMAVENASTAQGLSPELGATFDTLATKLANAAQNPAVLNMRGLARPIEQLRQDASGMFSPEMHTLLDRASQQGYMMSLRDARNLRSDIMQEARNMETGGVLRAPTPEGQTPRTGTGNPLAPRVMRQARILSENIESNIEAQTKPFGNDVYATYRLAQEASKVAAKQRWLEDFLSGPEVYDRSEGLFRGKAILNKLEAIRGSEERLADVVGTDTLKNLERYALGLAKLQETKGDSPSSVYHQVMRLAMRGAQFGGGYALAASGHPEMGLLVATTPEVLGMVLSSNKLSNLLVTGMNAPAKAKTGWEALGHVAGALHAAGAQPFQPPAQEEGAQPEVDGRQTTMHADFQKSLATAPMDRAEQYWNEYLAQQPDEAAKAAFQQAFQERFGRPVGGTAALLPAPSP